MEKLTTSPYRGTKDLYPERERLRQYTFQTWRRNAISYGYEEYSGPLLEPLSLYASKTSEEIVSEQLYSFADKSGRRLGIRPEMTPTLARMVAASRGKYPSPLRWFCIETCMRYERPQRGRMRQFDQLNMDILGGETRHADFEILSTIPSMMTSFNAPQQSYKVKMNHRGFINSYLHSQTSMEGKDFAQVLRLLDSYPKLSEEKFNIQAHDLGFIDAEIRALETLMKSPLDTLVHLLDENLEELSYINSLIKELNAIWGEEIFEFDASIMRGFDYYTGLIFEVMDCSPENNRALFGGGRYDNLVGAFGCEPLSGVGYGVSEISIYNFLETHQVLPSDQKPIDITAACLFDESGHLLLDQTLQKLRLQGFKCERILSSGKPAKILKQATKLKSQVVLMIGPDEAQKNLIKLKNLATSEEKALDAKKFDLIENLLTSWLKE